MNSATATALLADLQRGAISSEAIVNGLLDRADRLNRLNVFVHLDREQVLEQARDIDKQRRLVSPVGLLAGVPVAIKDVICVDGEPTTCGSRMLQTFRPPYDATVISRLKEAGAILFGKTNMDEFAMGSSTENSAYGPTLNPWDEDRVPGGSSGGSAAAMAAGLAPLALGSDTGGSIRQPAAVCGIVGLKPTYGRVSRYGLIAFASSLDQIGPFAHDLADAALILKVISGHDRHDSTSVTSAVPDYSATLDKAPESLRIGVVREFFGEGLDPEVEAAVREAIQIYEQAGATIKEVSLPYSKAASRPITSSPRRSARATWPATTARSLATVLRTSPHVSRRRKPRPARAHDDGQPSRGFWRRGQAADHAGHVRALGRLRRPVLQSGPQGPPSDPQRLRRGLQASGRADRPTSPTPAFRLGERTANPLAMYLSDIYTITANLAGIPGLSIPCGLTKSNLPIGLQLLSPAFAEEKLLRTARVFERETDWHLKRPELS